MKTNDSPCDRVDAGEIDRDEDEEEQGDIGETELEVEVGGLVRDEDVVAPPSVIAMLRLSLVS